MSIVAVDTQILIWAIKEQASSEQTAMIANAKSFLEFLDENGTNILIPTPVVTELLMRVPADSQPMLANLLERAFLVAPYDTKAAVIASTIWETHSSTGTIDAIRDEESVSRQEVKTDLMIVAISAAQDVRCLYSNDGGLRALSEGFVEAREMPIIPRQGTLNYADLENL